MKCTEDHFQREEKGRNARIGYVQAVLNWFGGGLVGVRGSRASGYKTKGDPQ